MSEPLQALEKGRSEVLLHRQHAHFHAIKCMIRIQSKLVVLMSHS